MAAALRVTRAAAIAQNRELDFVVNAERHSYGSSATGVAPIDPRVEIRIAVARLERTASAGWIRFFPSGRSSGGDIYLYLDRADARVRVNWATGHAALE
jgi:general secretion pathway protein H